MLWRQRVRGSAFLVDRIRAGISLPTSDLNSFLFAMVRTSHFVILEVPTVAILILAVAEGFEPSHGRINTAVPYQLGYATKIFLATKGQNAQNSFCAFCASCGSIWWLWVELNHQPRAYETLALSG